MSAEAVSNVIELAPKDETPARKNELSIYRTVEANLGAVGGIESAASIMEMDRGDLRRALDGKARFLAVEHVMRFNARISQDTAMRIGTAFMRTCDALVMPRVQLTAAEQARRYKQMLDTMSAGVGVDLAKKALETP